MSEATFDYEIVDSLKPGITSKATITRMDTAKASDIYKNKAKNAEQKLVVIYGKVEHDGWEGRVGVISLPNHEADHVENQDGPVQTTLQAIPKGRHGGRHCHGRERLLEDCPLTVLYLPLQNHITRSFSGNVTFTVGNFLCNNSVGG